MKKTILRKRDRAHLDDVKSKPCVACGAIPTDPAHVRSVGAGGGDEHGNVIALCRQCHTRQHALGWHRFISRYPLVGEELKKFGWELVEEFGVMKLRRL